MVAYVVEELQDVTLDIAGPEGRLAGHDLMSPFVWTEERRSVSSFVCSTTLGPTDPTGVIWGGDPDDGVMFRMRHVPAIVRPQSRRCRRVRGSHRGARRRWQLSRLLYRRRCSPVARSLLVAKGPELTELHEQRVMLKAPKSEGNIKEATLARVPMASTVCSTNMPRTALRGSAWRSVSRSKVRGRWSMTFPIREDAWDNWHLSTGPIVQEDGRDPVMFYNGATVDARWRIGWVNFAPDSAMSPAAASNPS
jgi:hypothetical protein